MTRAPLFLSTRRRLLAGAVCAPWLTASNASAAVGAQVQLLAAEVPPIADPHRGSIGSCVAQIARDAGHLSAARWLPWSRALLEAQRQGNTLLFPVARSPEVEASWQWVHFLGHEEVVLIVRRDAIGSLTELEYPQVRSKLRIGTTARAMHAPQLSMAGYLTTDNAPSEVANARKLAAKRIEAWATAGSVADLLLASERVDRRALYPPVRLGLMTLYLAATPDVDRAHLQPWLDAAHSG